MIVDKERKVIYLHNPKCGGTFLRNIYIEKYGKTDATKWWKAYDRKNGTDLGHITYKDLPRFIPEWEEYRIVVMVRNPYNRFYSAVKELTKHSNNVGRFPQLPVIMLDEYQESNLLRKIYLRTICLKTYRLRKLSTASVNDICYQILRCSDQDFYLRNKRIPWLNPQSYFLGKNVEVFQYESESDWKKLLELLELSDYQNRVSIARDYAMSEDIRSMIMKAYPEDRVIYQGYI
ncbi:sulfotransferase family 2 domain-containing protein [Parabacteroides timonensis]|uniref:sulfotransferase family 2 domain-containing protein n=1 Tax=Parabacteroides timonensis TaxID=1871013 RepID=UPI00094EFC69|nr:sulfotransferase family 2 domain-containing protein [Parabacteroides timonensis]